MLLKSITSIIIVMEVWNKFSFLKCCSRLCGNAFIDVACVLESRPGVSKLFCPKATQGNTEHVEGRTSYAMRLLRNMLYSTKSTNFL